MKRKPVLLSIAIIAPLALGAIISWMRLRPSPGASKFRAAVQAATEVRLYNHIAETAGPSWGDAEWALSDARPVFRLRGRDLNEFVRSLEMSQWRVANGPQIGSSNANAFAAEFYQGSKCLVHLRFLPGQARWYDPNGYVGDAALTPQSWRDLEKRLSP